MQNCGVNVVLVDITHTSVQLCVTLCSCKLHPPDTTICGSAMTLYDEVF